MHKIFRVITRYLSMIVLALGLFGIIIWISGKNPIVSYRELFGSTLGSWYGFSEVLVAMTPMLITALAVALPSRIGLINVGVEGQLYMGACAATWGALIFSSAPAWILLPVMAIFGMLGGALWALIPGLLRAMGLVNETITTLLLNSVAPKIVAFFVFGFWHSPMDTNKTPNFVDAARLPTFFGTRVDLGLIIGILLLIVFWLVMKHTRWGLEMRAIGGNPEAAQRNGVPVKVYIVAILCIGGAIGGLAGMVLVSGYYGVLLTGFSRGVGYIGFLISWLSFGDPIGIVLTSFVVAIITTGGSMLQLTTALPYAIINILLAVALFVVLSGINIFPKRKAV
ncbi:MAG: ABC transporter permease [Anaerolineales bacterium]|nr:ABC transporter permease [Anaerolineales bacterium]